MILFESNGLVFFLAFSFEIAYGLITHRDSREDLFFGGVFAISSRLEDYYYFLDLFLFVFWGSRTKDSHIRTILLKHGDQGLPDKCHFFLI